MDDNPEQKELRKRLRSFIHGSKISVVVSAPNELDFKTSIYKAILQLIKENRTEINFPICISLDQGIFKNLNDEVLILLQNDLNKYPVFLFEEQDSKIIRGIQVADLVASKCSTMLKEALGLVDKTVKAGPKSGYDPDMEINIGFELWADIRYNFFSDPPPDPDVWDSMLNCKAFVGKKGLYISENCSDKIKIAATERFGEMYLGCIH